MFLLRKAKSPQISKNKDDSAAGGVNFQVVVHYGIPSTASILAFDPIQSLLAIGTTDGRIKVIGGDNIEGLLVSPKQSPYKYLEFLHNQGFLVGISNEDDIQVWDLESRSIVSSLQWESSITAFSVIYASLYMYIGDEYGMISVLKYETEAEVILQLPYHLSADYLKGVAGDLVSLDQPIVSILPQPCSSGKRVLIAYAGGLLIIFDIVEARVLVIKGDKVLQLKNKVLDNSDDEHNGPAEGYEEECMEEKEISTVCWASSSGSILSVGYIDGDIMFWRTINESSCKSKHSGSSFNDVVKLQLSRAEKRLPVVVLHWSANNKSSNDGDGQLFIYGGCEIGSEEVITVLNLEWSSRLETLRCTGRVDLNLRSSFADMILTPCAGTKGNKNSNSLFVLTNPGKLQFVDDTKLSSEMSQQEKKISLTIIEFPAVVPTTDPRITVAKLFMLPLGGTLSKRFSKPALQVNSQAPLMDDGSRWPLTGGMSSRSQFEDSMVRLVYVSGYRDGSVRIWDATYPDLSLICVLENKVKDMNLGGSNASVLKLDFCCHTSHLAVGNESGLVYICDLNGRSEDTSSHFVTETKHEVHKLPEEKKNRYRAVFSLFNSPVQALQFTSWGTKLSVGFECGRIALFDMNSLSLIFLTDPVSATSSLVISLLGKEFTPLTCQFQTPKNAGSKIPDDHIGDFIFVLTKDAKIYVVNGSTGTMINSQPMHLKKDSTAISMYVLEINTTVLGSEKVSPREVLSGTGQLEIEGHTSETVHARGNLNDSHALLCCKDELRLYHTKSVIQGENKTVLKVRLDKPCCWTATYRNHEKVSGLVLLYQTGELEVRSLNDLQVVKRGSLMSTLRWNFKLDMEKVMSSTDSGLIALTYGRELAFISLLASENNVRDRVPDYFASLHDKVLAAAAEAAISFSANQKKNQGTTPGILRGLMRGVKRGQKKNADDSFHAFRSHYGHLEDIFSQNPPAAPSADNQEVKELDIDDIEIDQPAHSPSTSSSKPRPNEREKESERQKLLDGASTSDMKPRQRTPAEIMATYRKTGDVSSAAGQAKNKLMERQEKLERMSRKTQDLQNGAEEFASLANELVKIMENRKWWQI